MSKSKDGKIEVGSKVNVVTVHHGAIEADVINVRSDSLLDVLVDVPGDAGPTKITSCPHDPTGTAHDSWHRIP